MSRRNPNDPPTILLNTASSVTRAYPSSALQPATALSHKSAISHGAMDQSTEDRVPIDSGTTRSSASERETALRNGGSHHATPPDFDYQGIAVIAWRTLRRLGVPESSLADASQDVLLVLHRRREDFRGDASLSTWVYGIVLRVASNYRRTRKRSFALFDSSRNASEIPVSAKAPSPLDVIEQRAAVEMLERILADMPEELRSAFVLVELEELETAEAATVLQVSESTCRSWLQRARKTFNAAVAREELRHSRELGGRP